MVAKFTTEVGPNVMNELTHMMCFLGLLHQFRKIMWHDGR
jgi:hypothetical protein